MGQIDRDFPDNPHWEWREISVSKTRNYARSEQKTIMHKWLRFSGRIYHFSYINVSAQVLYTATKRQVDSGMGETSMEASSFRMSRARIVIQESGCVHNRSYAARCFRNAVDGLNVEEITDLTLQTK